MTTTVFASEVSDDGMSVKAQEVTVSACGSVSPEPNNGDENNNNNSKATSRPWSREVSRPWTREEDRMITEHVTRFGTKSWSQLVAKIPSRTGKQMRERWHNQLDPNIRKDPWSPEEDKRLLKAYQKYGSRWAEIAKLFQGRTDNSIKNRWYGNVRKGARTFEKSGDVGGSIPDSPILPANITGAPGDIPPPRVKKSKTEVGGEEKKVAGVKRKASDASFWDVSAPPAKSAAVEPPAPTPFSTMGEAMLACWRILNDVIVRQLPLAHAASSYVPAPTDVVDVKAALEKVKSTLENGEYTSVHEMHADVVKIWRETMEKAHGTVLYATALVLSQVFDELYFKSVYLAMNSQNTQGPTAVGTRVRIYSSPEHQWWYGRVSEWDDKQQMALVTEECEATQQPLQVWTGIPSFYAEVVDEAGNVQHPVFSGSSCGRLFAVREGEPMLESGLKKILEGVSVSSLFPAYKGDQCLMQAIQAWVKQDQPDAIKEDK